MGSRPVEVVALSGEWSAVESSGSDRFETLDIHEQRRTRYAKMAREEQRMQAAREVPRCTATTWSPPGTGRLDTWMNTLVLIYVAAAGEFANALCLLPSQLLVIYIQSYLALCDSELEKRRSWLKASDWRCLSFGMINPAPPQGYDALIVIVCGGVCAYTVLIIERVALEGKFGNVKSGPRESNARMAVFREVALVSMFSKRSFIWGDVGSFDCLIRFMRLGSSGSGPVLHA
ncbi:hypothetical protein AK812_SmicGene34073 [Symbiodinium microadriaticum]|uniref:Uncharacterized protein n=1 Tax=Symbiodinium microadriaticum TaxID=2951 RepID=A0A1Q9CPY3_SYMMI|nr:hypothetical protein AK812_SmicGene34073 [Symbiodinium microadriaticum]